MCSRKQGLEIGCRPQKPGASKAAADKRYRDIRPLEAPKPNDELESNNISNLQVDIAYDLNYTCKSGRKWTSLKRNELISRRGPRPCQPKRRSWNSESTLVSGCSIAGGSVALK